MVEQNATLEEYGIKLTDAPEKQRKGINWIFPDSKHLPMQGHFMGTGEIKGTSGQMIPVYIFDIDGGSPWLISQWNKQLRIPVDLTPKCECRIYIDKESAPDITVLKLN